METFSAVMGYCLQTFFSISLKKKRHYVNINQDLEQRFSVKAGSCHRAEAKRVWLRAAPG